MKKVKLALQHSPRPKTAPKSQIIVIYRRGLKKKQGPKADQEPEGLCKWVSPSNALCIRNTEEMQLARVSGGSSGDVASPEDSLSYP